MLKFILYFLVLIPFVGDIYSSELLIRPGDVIKIQMPGEADFEGNFHVKRDGKMNLPEIGNVSLIGKSLPEVNSLLKDIIGQKYRALNNFNVNIVERRVPVNVLGFVNKPGLIDLPEDGNIQMAIELSGGASSGAQLDKLQLNRQGEVIIFNYKEYLDTGDFSILPILQPLDVIFVPASPLMGNVQMDFDAASFSAVNDSGENASVIKVIGGVKSPGRYKWSDEMSFLDILAHAGGPTKDADISRVKILKKSIKTNMIIFDLDLFINEGGDFSKLPILGAGDTIIISELSADTGGNKSSWLRQSQESSIYVFGQVGQAGRYAFDNKLHFLDILSAANGPNSRSDIHNIKVTHRSNFKSKVSTVDLGLYFETGDESLLPLVQSGDTIYVPEKDKPWLDNKKENTVRIIGAVKNPGRYTFNSHMTILDILAESGGPTVTAYIENIVVVNISRNNKKDNVSHMFNLEKFFDNPDFENLPAVRAGDTIYVPDVSQSNWSVFMDNVTDMLRIVSLVAIVGGL